MRYYIRKRGEDSINGPLSVEELQTHIKNGIVSVNDMALQDSGQTEEQLRRHWDFKWTAITSFSDFAAYRPPEPATAAGSQEGITRRSISRAAAFGFAWAGIRIVFGLGLFLLLFFVDIKVSIFAAAGGGWLLAAGGSDLYSLLKK